MSAAAGFGADFARGQRWAEPSLSDLRRIMRQLAGGREVEHEPDRVRQANAATPDPRRQKAAAVRHGDRVSAKSTVDALYAAARAYAAADPIEAAELAWRYERVAPGVRQRALRAQRELVARYNREAVARIVMRRLRAIARRL